MANNRGRMTTERVARNWEISGIGRAVYQVHDSAEKLNTNPNFMILKKV
jgi:hypothetical protein